MSSAAAIVACALVLLGKSERTMPRIEFVDATPRFVSPLAEAFVRRPDNTIYLVTSSSVFQDALRKRELCAESESVKKIASILAHEEWHIKNGPDERRAYEAQLATLIRLGVQPASALYGSVVKSMQTAIRQRRYDRPDLVLAAGAQ